jgi:hypothetical protein
MTADHNGLNMDNLIRAMSPCASQRALEDHCWPADIGKEGLVTKLIRKMQPYIIAN